MTATTQISTGVDHPIRYHLEADHPLRETALMFAETYLDLIIEDMVNHPRSLQKKIGPSEIGIPCNIRVLHKLNQDDEPPRSDYPWKPAIGTAVHAWLEDIFTKATIPGGPQETRFLVEEKNVVGNILGEPHAGSTDLFDDWLHIVADHKCVGKPKMKEYRAHGPSPQYRTQAHLYGKGWEDRGKQVDLVAICFLPREGEMTDTYIWTEPYDRAIAEAALERVNRLAALLQAVGISQAVQAYGPCDDTWCPWCGTGSSFPRRPTTGSPFSTQ
jgi:hypothetical protein